MSVKNTVKQILTRQEENKHNRKTKSGINTDKLILTQHDALEQMSKKMSVKNTDKQILTRQEETKHNRKTKSGINTDRLILRLQSVYEQKNKTRYARRAITYKLLPTNFLTT
ncbi:hypothetical protein DPMN_111372 [Dreissena polymorpha]|uniref:Uncharacterized protein n=1 Tax=Dreissena polymorpha TaxID=45954 RepID=A0A9D4KDQ6_DREPO|nr:hypothetical protein DPMN_111372 [Dreissena polymorpha]